MSGKADLVVRVRAALSAAPAVTEKRMFGSQGFLVRGHLCVAARPERLLCRIDPAQHDAALAEDGCTPVVMRGRVYRGYVHVTADALRGERQLRRWIERALAHNAALPPKPPPPTSSSKAPSKPKPPAKRR